MMISQINLTRSEFLKAWDAWDRNPSSEYTATNMENACVKLADMLNCSVVNLRNLIAEERRSNIFKEDIVDNLFMLVDAGLTL